MSDKELLELAERILEKSLIQIEYLITNAKQIKKYTENMVDLSKIDGYRTGITLVYMCELNTGVLESVTLNDIFMFLDGGFFVENELDYIVSNLAD